jgi:AcrR family transcriptional regulator
MKAAASTSPLAGRQRILEACIPLFAENGFNGVSIRDASAAAGMTPAALYYHFPDKDALYLAVIDWLYQDRVPGLLAQVAENGSPWERLERLVSGMVQLNLTDPNLLRLSQWILLDRDTERTRRLGKSVVGPFLDAVSSLVSDISDDIDPRWAALSVFSLVMLPFHAAGVTADLAGFRHPICEPAALTAHVMQMLRAGIAGRGAS